MSISHPLEGRWIIQAGGSFHSAHYFTRTTAVVSPEPILTIGADGTGRAHTAIKPGRHYLMIAAGFGPPTRDADRPLSITDNQTTARALNFYYNDYYADLIVAEDMTFTTTLHEHGADWPDSDGDAAPDPYRAVSS